VVTTINTATNIVDRQKVTHFVRVVVVRVGNGPAVSRVASNETFINNQSQSQSSSSSSTGSVAGAAVAVSGRAGFTG